MSLEETESMSKKIDDYQSRVVMINGSLIHLLDILDIECDELFSQHEGI